MFEVLSTSGDTHLGGDDFDKRIVDFLAEDFQKNEGIDLRKDRQALQRLTEAAEKAKIELSALAQTSINLPFITATAEGPKHIDTTLSRAKFEEMCSDLLDRCKRPVEQALRDAKLSINGGRGGWSETLQFEACGGCNWLWSGEQLLGAAAGRAKGGGQHSAGGQRVLSRPRAPLPSTPGSPTHPSPPYTPKPPLPQQTSRR